MPRFVEGCDNPPADGTVDASITRYLGMLDTADRQEDRVAELRIGRLTEHLEALRRQMRQLQVMERVVADAPDHQVSLTDPDARAMATNGKGTGMVGYNVQTVVDAKHHLIIAHEVTNVGHDKHQLANMARQANEVTGANGLTVLADRDYFSGEEIVACEAAGATPIAPKPLTSGAKADGRFGKQDFIYQPETDTYRCPAGEQLIWRYTTVEHGLTLSRYWSSNCGACAMKAMCEAKERLGTRRSGDDRGHAFEHSIYPRPRYARAVRGNQLPGFQAPKCSLSSANPSTTISVAGLGTGSGGPAGPHSSGRRTKAVR